jgi:methyl-accepting chemotaxis protein
MASNSLTRPFALLRLNIGPKALIGAVLLITTSTALAMGAAYWSLTRDFDARATRDIDVSLRTLALAFGETFREAKVSVRGEVVDRVEIAKMPEFKTHEIVDRVTSYVGGTATLFAYDEVSRQFVRRTTNLKKENGDRAVGTELAADHPAQAAIRRGEVYKGPAVLFGRRFYTAYQPIVDAAGSVIGIAFVGVRTEELDTALHQALSAMAIATALAALVTLGLTMMLVRRIVNPIRAVTQSLTGLAEGRMDVEVKHSNRHDEIGAIARTIEVFRESQIERAQIEAERANAAKQALARDQRKSDLNRFVDEFRAKVGSTIDGLLNSSEQLEVVAHKLSAEAHSTAEISGQSADTSRHASEHVRSAAGTADELSQSVVEISRRVRESNDVAADAVKQAAATDERMVELSKAGDRIGEVVKLINSIAEQTNLLALNATIEAARAGEAGRGFAVVAQEVKALAGQTAKATDEISGHIVNMQRATEDSVGSIKVIGQTIEQISQITASISVAVEQQGAAIQNIAGSVQAAASDTAQVADNTERVAKGAGDTGATSSQMLESAKALSSESIHLKAEVENFLDGVRAA